MPLTQDFVVNNIKEESYNVSEETVIVEPIKNTPFFLAFLNIWAVISIVLFIVFVGFSFQLSGEALGGFLLGSVPFLLIMAFFVIVDIFANIFYFFKTRLFQTKSKSDDLSTSAKSSKYSYSTAIVISLCILLLLNFYFIYRDLSMVYF